MFELQMAYFFSSAKINVPTSTDAFLFDASLFEIIVNLPPYQFTHSRNIPVQVFPFVLFVLPDLENNITTDNASVGNLRCRFFRYDLSLMLGIT